MDPFTLLDNIDDVERVFREYEGAGQGAMHRAAALRQKITIFHREVQQRRELRGADAHRNIHVDGVEPLEEYYEMHNIYHFWMPAFQTEGRDYTMRIAREAFGRNVPFDECMAVLYKIFEGIIEDLLGHIPDEAHARLIIMPTIDNNPDPNALHQPISTSYQRVRLITPELIMAHIENIAQSKKLFLLNKEFKIHVVHTLHPVGNGRKSNCVQIRDKRSVWSVCAHDNHCLGETIVYGMELNEKRE